MRQITGQIPDGTLQLLAVVEALTQNDLPVHFNARLIEPVHLFQRLPCEPVVQHPAAQPGIGGLKGNVDGRHVVFDDALHILLRHIGERHIVALQKGKPGIVVLKIERGPHSRGHLVDKAEDALIGAGTVIVHQPIFKNDAQILLILLINFQQPFLPGWLCHQHLHIVILGQILIVEHVLNRLSVYLKEPVSGPDFHFFRDTARFNPGDQMSFFLHRFSPVCPGCRILPFTGTGMNHNTAPCFLSILLEFP